MMRNSPKGVGSRASATRCTSRSCCRRWATICATVMKVIPCSAAKRSSSGRRAIVPSGFSTSQITPAGYSPARRARSTLASVWPTRCSTPPGRDRSGKTWPGRRRSAAVDTGSIATRMVADRSAALMPVVTPNRAAASTLTVKAVSCASVLWSTICGSPSASHRSCVSVRQISPRPCTSMKLIVSGVIFSAAAIRSPSFSRASSSATSTSFPARTSAIACSTVPNGI